MTRIALLNIGTELLKGRTLNTNASFIGEFLRKNGYSLDRTLVIHDEADEIEESFDSLLENYEVVLVTGGLGPTKDDITKKVLLKKFGGELVRDEPSYQRVSEFFKRLGRTMNSENDNQSMVPTSCEVLQNQIGTAPGMLFRKGKRILISMPGVPFEMKALMKSEVLRAIRENFPSQFMISRIIKTHGIPESKLAERMKGLEHLVADNISVAYLPSLDGTKIEMAIRGNLAEKAALEAALKKTQKALAGELEKYVYSLEDKQPDQLLAEYLLANKLTLATAESCTGGLIAAKIVSNSGVSAVFKGSVVAYMIETKVNVIDVPQSTIDQEGVVSESVAIAMAEGVRTRLNSDIGLSITGIAEAAKDAGPEDSPQAWIGYADGKRSFAKHIRFFQGRKINIERAAYAALILALRAVQE